MLLMELVKHTQSHHGTPSWFLKAQRQSYCPTAKAHPWPMLSWGRVTVIAVCLEAVGGGWSRGRGSTDAAWLFSRHRAMFKRSFGCHFESVGGGAASDFLDSVAWRFEEDDVDLVEENTGQHPEAGCEYSNDFHSWNKLAISTKVGRDERDPNNEEYKHTESDKLGFCKVFWEFSGFKCKEETNSCQETSVANEKCKSHLRALVASDKNDLINVMIHVAERRSVVKPDHTNHYLHKCEEEHQKKLKV